MKTFDILVTTTIFEILLNDKCLISIILLLIKLKLEFDSHYHLVIKSSEMKQKLNLKTVPQSKTQPEENTVA